MYTRQWSIYVFFFVFNSLGTNYRRYTLYNSVHYEKSSIIIFMSYQSAKSISIFYYQYESSLWYHLIDLSHILMVNFEIILYILCNTSAFVFFYYINMMKESKDKTYWIVPVIEYFFFGYIHLFDCSLYYIHNLYLCVKVKDYEIDLYYIWVYEQVRTSFHLLEK